MKKSEFKKIIKPIVSECIKESLIEDGLISGIIAEVVKGMSSSSVMSPAPPKEDSILERMQRSALRTEQTSALQGRKKKLMESVGADVYNGVNLFEGTTPLVESGHASADPGVDITNILGAVGTHWNAHMAGSKREEK